MDNKDREILRLENSLAEARELYDHLLRDTQKEYTDLLYGGSSVVGVLVVICLVCVYMVTHR